MTRKAEKGSKRKAQKTGLNRSMLDVGMGMLRLAIEYKLAEAGGFFVEVPTVKVKPSQRCASCWELTPKTLADRLHICQHCRHTEDRDINSAQVCLIWAKGLGTSLSNVNGSSSTSTHCGGFKQLALPVASETPSRLTAELGVVH